MFKIEYLNMNIYSNALWAFFNMVQIKMDIGHIKHLFIKLEDCIDVMEGIYGNKFILQLMVYNSCGHYWKCEDELNVNVINVGHCGRKLIMHYSKMTKTYLGEFVSGIFAILKVGDTQDMVFILMMLVHMRFQ